MKILKRYFGIAKFHKNFEKAYEQNGKIKLKKLNEISYKNMIFTLQDFREIN